MVHIIDRGRESRRNFIASTMAPITVESDGTSKTLNMAVTPYFRELAPVSRRMTISFDLYLDAEASMSYAAVMYYQADVPSSKYYWFGEVRMQPGERYHFARSADITTIAGRGGNPYISFNSLSGKVTVSNVMFVFGSEEADYVPAPEEINDRLAAIEAKLGITADEIWPDGPGIMDEPADYAGGGNIAP